MKLSLVRHLWGVDGSQGFDTHEAHWREVGYEMIEGNLRHSPHPEQVAKLLEKGEWPFIAQIFSRDFEPGGSVGEHLATLRHQIEELVCYEPIFFNAHSGADSWSMEETLDFYGRLFDLGGTVVCRALRGAFADRSLGGGFLSGALRRTLGTGPPPGRDRPRTRGSGSRRRGR